MTRMREQMIDVDLVVTRRDVIMGGGFTSTLEGYMRQMRQIAAARAAEVGGSLRSTLRPEFILKEGISPILGDVFAMSTRWVADVPDEALTSPER